MVPSIKWQERTTVPLPEATVLKQFTQSPNMQCWLRKPRGCLPGPPSEQHRFPTWKRADEDAALLRTGRESVGEVQGEEEGEPEQLAREEIEFPLRQPTHLRSSLGALLSGSATYPPWSAAA